MMCVKGMNLTCIYHSEFSYYQVTVVMIVLYLYEEHIVATFLVLRMHVNIDPRNHFRFHE